MNTLARAEAALARVRAHRPDVVTPDAATSPMDQASTVQIPRSVVAAADPRAAAPPSTAPRRPGPAAAHQPPAP